MFERIAYGQFKGGLLKRWPLKNREDFYKLLDYELKIDYSVQDLNMEIKQKEPLVMKDFLFIIMETVWIYEAIQRILSCYDERIIAGFVFEKEDKFGQYAKYLQAIRSFTVAHPLTTNRHKLFGFDGSLICVDIRSANQIAAPSNYDSFYHLDVDGIQKQHCPDDDFYLYAYSEKDAGMHFFKYIGCSIGNVFDAARVFIEKLQALDKYLFKQKRAAYKGVT